MSPVDPAPTPAEGPGSPRRPVVQGPLVQGPVVQSLVFFGLAVLLGLPLAGAVKGLGMGSGLVPTLLMVAYMFSPAAAAAILLRRSGRPVREGVGLRLRASWWLLGAWAFPVAMALLALAASVAWPGVSLSLDMAGLVEHYASALPPDQLAELEAQLADAPPAWLLLPLMVVQGVVAGTTINALAALGEEAGWRGYLHELLAPLGFWRASLWTGVLWGLWHTPLILQGHNYPDHPVAGVVLMTLMCVLVSPAMTLVRERTDTVLSAAVFHGTFNGLAGLPLVFLQGGSDLVVGVTGLAGACGLLLLNGVVWALRARP